MLLYYYNVYETENYRNISKNLSTKNLKIPTKKAVNFLNILRTNKIATDRINNSKKYIPSYDF